MTTYIYFSTLEEIGGQAGFMTRMLLGIIYHRRGHRDFEKLKLIETILSY